MDPNIKEVLLEPELVAVILGDRLAQRATRYF